MRVEEKGRADSSRKSKLSLLRRRGALRPFANCWKTNSIKKPKTHRYPSLKGTDPKFRRNHRHALHGTMKALVSIYLFLFPFSSLKRPDFS